jgi:hypothetical protein
VVSILAPNGVKKIAELGNSLRRLHLIALVGFRYALEWFDELCAES